MSATRLQLQRRFAREDARARENAFAFILQSPEGRRFLWWLLGDICGVERTPFRPNALSMSFECGQQNVGLLLKAEILSKFPDDYLEMTKEMSHEYSERSRLLADADRADARDDPGSDDADALE